MNLPPTPEQVALMEQARRHLAKQKANAARARTKAARQRDTGGNRKRWRALNAFCDLDKQKSGLRPGDVALWMVMFRHADPNGGVRLAQSRMQEYTGLSRRGVQLALKRLMEKGQIEQVKRGGPNSGLASYRVAHPVR